MLTLKIKYMDQPFLTRDNRYIFGRHVHKYSTFTQTVQRVFHSTKKFYSANAMQIYLSSSKNKKPIKAAGGGDNDTLIDDVLKARHLISSYDIFFVAHGSLLYNLSGTVNPKSSCRGESLDRTIKGLASELDVVAGLGGAGVVVHMGSCTDRQYGIESMADTISKVLTVKTTLSEKFSNRLGITENEFIKSRKIILENSSGEGTKLGSNLEGIQEIFECVPDKLINQVGVCIDTAHAFGAGIYDWGNPQDITKFYSDFDRLIGLKHLTLFHLNDSRMSDEKQHDAPFGSRKDRHEHLGFGYIFGRTEKRLQSLTKFLCAARVHGIPMICEPPGNSPEFMNERILQLTLQLCITVGDMIKHGEDAVAFNIDLMVIESLLSTTSFPLYS